MASVLPRSCTLNPLSMLNVFWRSLIKENFFGMLLPNGFLGTMTRVMVDFHDCVPASISSQILPKVPGGGGEEATEALVDGSHNFFSL